MQKHITLRPWNMDDAPRLAELINDPKVLKYLTINMPNPYRTEDAVDFLTKVIEQQLPQRAILYHGAVVGCIGALQKDDNCSVGYWLGKDWHGQGIATRALQQFLQQIPELLPGTKHVISQTFEPNKASIRVLQKCGFTPAGLVDNAPLAGDGQHYTALNFSRSL